MDTVCVVGLADEESDGKMVSHGSAIGIGLTGSSATSVGPLVPSNNTPKRLCLVCGDQASGFHYGVASCEACKAFFKRTIQGNIEYTCPATGDCEINKRRRKACQACRFHKCLRMGMLKEGVRLDRVRGGRQKYRRAPDSNSSTPGTGYTTVEVNATKDSSHSNRVLSFKSSQAYGTGHHDGIYTGSTGQQASSSEGKKQTTSNGLSKRTSSQLDDNQLLSALMNYESHRSSSTMSGKSKSFTVKHHLTVKKLKTEVKTASDSDSDDMSDDSTDSDIRTFSDLVDRELVCIIGFAKQIPGFTDLLLNDQMRLLQSAWTEMLALTIAFRSQHLIAQNELKLCVDDDFIMNETSCNMGSFFLQLILLARRIAELDMNREEYLLLKALILTNSDTQLEDEERVYILRDMTQNSLQDLLVSLYPSGSSASSRLLGLTLMLPLVRQLDATMRIYWSSVRDEGKVEMNKLFVEMLDSKMATYISPLEDKSLVKYTGSASTCGRRYTCM